MAKNTLNAPHFHSERRAREFLEKLRWNGHPVCPHCDAVSSPYATKRMGRYRCSSKACRKDFSVTTKTMMESSHINLHIWLQAFYYMAPAPHVSRDAAKTPARRSVEAKARQARSPRAERTASSMAHSRVTQRRRCLSRIRSGSLSPRSLSVVSNPSCRGLLIGVERTEMLRRGNACI